MVWLEIAVLSVSGGSESVLTLVRGMKMRKVKREAGDHIPNQLRDVQGPNLTHACSRGLQTTPFRNCDSGLPKEAYIGMSNFRANGKMAISCNLKAKLLTY